MYKYYQNKKMNSNSQNNNSLSSNPNALGSMQHQDSNIESKQINRGQVKISSKDTERAIGEAGIPLSNLTGPGKGKSTLASAGSNVLEDPLAGGRNMPQRSTLLKKKTETDSNKNNSLVD